MVVQAAYQTWVQTMFYKEPYRTLGKDTAAIVSGTVSAVTLVISPILGVFSDFYFLRLPFIAGSALVYSTFTMLLYLVDRTERREMAMAFIWVVGFSFRVNETFVPAFMPSLCNDRDMGFVSGLGFCTGFLGGVVVMLLVRMVTNVRPEESEEIGIQRNRLSMLMVGIIMMLTILTPLFMLDNGLPPGTKRPKAQAKVFGDAFKELAHTFRTGFSTNRNVTLLLFIYFFSVTSYQTSMGLLGNLFIDNALHATTQRGWTPATMQEGVIIYNVLVAVTSISYGIFVRRTGAKPFMLVSIISILLGSFLGIYWQELADVLGIPFDKSGIFYCYGYFVITAFGVGPIQALCRGVIGVLAPVEKKCEIFGIMETFQLLAAIIGVFSAQGIYHHGYQAVNWLGIAFILIALTLTIIVPIRKAEKQARADLEKFGVGTLDELRAMQKLETDDKAEVVVRDGDDHDTDSSTSTSESDSDRVLGFAVDARIDSSEGEVDVGEGSRTFTQGMSSSSESTD